MVKNTQLVATNTAGKKLTDVEPPSPAVVSCLAAASLGCHTRFSRL